MEDWMESLNGMGEEPQTNLKVFINDTLRGAFLAAAETLDGSGFDSAVGILTHKKSVILALGFGLDWSLQRAVFGSMPSVWDRSVPADTSVGHWSGSYATDSTGKRFWVVDLEITNPLVGYQFTKARLVFATGQEGVTEYDGICMDAAPFFPPWRPNE
jgi:hypothetical protein